jgi:Ni,Fe-hydrogenase III small subunit
MFTDRARRRSISVYHLPLGGADAAALEWRALLAPRFQARLKQLGVCVVDAASAADVVVVTGLLTARNLDRAMLVLEAMPTPSVLVAAGNEAIDGGMWAASDVPGLAPYPLTHYADVSLLVPGSPPTLQALLEALDAAARLVANPNVNPDTVDG